jgi:ribosomal protein L32
VVVQVPVSVGGAYPGPHPAYRPRQSFVPPPGWQPGQYPAPLVAQIPPQASGGAGPAPPPPAALYGGYYAPGPQNMGWAPVQQQGNAVPVQGYYAPPLPSRRHSNSRRNSRGEQAAPALASGSGSRRSQRRSQTQAAAQAAAPSTGAQEQAKPAEAVTERSA